MTEGEPARATCRVAFLGVFPRGPPPSLSPSESHWDGAVGGNTGGPHPNSRVSAVPGGKSSNLRATIKFALPDLVSAICSQGPSFLLAAANPCARQRAAMRQPGSAQLFLSPSLVLKLPPAPPLQQLLEKKPSVSTPCPASTFCPWPEGGSSRWCGSSCVHAPLWLAGFPGTKPKGESCPPCQEGPWPLSD